MSKEIPKKNMVFYALVNGLAYNFAEVIILGVYIVGASQGYIWEPALYAGFILAVLWTLAMSMRYSEQEARVLVLSRFVFLTDFIIAIILTLSIAFVLRGESWYFWAIFLAAAVQNARYLMLAIGWLEDERKLKGEEAN